MLAPSHISSKDDLQVAIPVGRLTALQQVPVKDLENGNHLYRIHEDLTGIKKTAKPYTRTQVKAETSAETLNHCSISSCHPRLHLQDLVAGCRLSRLPLIAYSPSHGPSLEPATVFLTHSCFLDLILVIC